MKTKKAFTLVELLVVIAIIALLMAILMPALQKAREMGMRAVCLSNVHQLALAWVLYAEANDGKIVNSNTSLIREVPSGSGDYQWDLNPAVPVFSEPTWVGWVDRFFIPRKPPSTAESSFGTTIEEQIAEIEIGLLFTYVKDIDSYKCPVGRRGNERTYAIVDSMNGWPAGPANLINKNINQVKRAGEKIVFLDCGEQSLASWTLVYNSASWCEPAQSRHSDGTTFGFADGHSEYRKWKHPNTKLVGQLSFYDFFMGYRPPELGGSSWFCQSINPGPDPNPDFLWIQRGMWGKSYK